MSTGKPTHEKSPYPDVMASSIALQVSKKELRTLMKKKLSDISPQSISSQSDIAYNRLQSLKPYQDAKRIGVYLAMPSGEIQTDAIVRHALEMGKKVFVPYLHKAVNPPPGTPKSVMNMVDVRSISDYDSLKRDSWGIPTIAADTVEEREHILSDPRKESEGLDMILMPGVAFDVDPKSGFVRRLGHGKGFYDYFLHRYTQMRGSPLTKSANLPDSGVVLYGLALAEQLLKVEDENSVPVGEYDSLLHGLLVGDGAFVAGPPTEQ